MSVPTGPIDLASLPPVLTVEEASRLLRISRGSAYEAARRGELPVIRVGRTLRVPRARLLELIGLPPAELAPAAEGCSDEPL